MNNANNETDKVMRSLLQKAVRRGNIETTRKIISYLLSINDFDWLRKRLAVITFEECWPYGLLVSYEKDPDIITRHYLNLASSVKNRDAAGLGLFAFEYSEGDRSVEAAVNRQDFYHIKNVSAGLENPGTFWEWAFHEVKDDHRKSTFLAKAAESHKKASWPWDKAFIIAAAYLGTTAGVSPVKYKKNETELPFWVGIDKHTRLGKIVIKKVAREKGVNEEIALMLSFYFEGAAVNNSFDSPWWEKGVKRKLQKAQLSFSGAEETWNMLRPRVAELLFDESLKTEQKLKSVNNESIPKQNGQQLGLF